MHCNEGLNISAASNECFGGGISMFQRTGAQLILQEKFLSDKRIGYEETKQCVLCGNSNFDLVAKKDRYGLKLDTVVCAKCGLLFSLYQLDDESAVIFYSEYYRPIYDVEKNDYLESLEEKYYSKSYNIKHASFLRTGSVVVEIGTAGGWNLIPYRKFEHYGFDYDERYLKYGRENHGLNLYRGDEKEIGNRGIASDYLIARHVLEHVRNPENFLLDLKATMKVGGILNISVPFSDSLLLDDTGLTGTLQLAHNFLFDEFTLNLLALKCGFSVVLRIGGNIVLKRGTIESEAEEKDKYNVIITELDYRQRGGRIKKRIKISEQLNQIKNCLLPKLIRSRLYYLYYIIRPISVVKKYMMFGRILAP